MKGDERSTHSRRNFLCSVSPLILAAAVEARQEPSFSTAIQVVNVLANVRTKKGEIVRTLNQDDFELAEDGRRQRIRYFARQSDLPLLLGLLIDTSMSQEHVLDSERSACFRFLDQVLRPDKDRFFIQQFDMQVWMRQELTSSWKDLNNTLASVNTPSRRELSNQSGPGTLLYDAIVSGSRILEGQHGRKALIVLSDGVDTGSDATLTSALEVAQRADTLVYSILFSDAGFYRLRLGGSGGRGVLARLSKETGAGFFEVSKKLSIDQIFDEIESELRNQYSLGYVSDKPARIGEFRKIGLTTKEKGLVIQARERYWAKPIS